MGICLLISMKPLSILALVRSNLASYDKFWDRLTSPNRLGDRLVYFLKFTVATRLVWVNGLGFLLIDKNRFSFTLRVLEKRFVW